MQIGVSPGTIEMPRLIYLGSFPKRFLELKKVGKKIVALTVVAVLGSSGAFTNSNSVALSGTDRGSGPVYGYNITNIAYSVIGGVMLGMAGMYGMGSDFMQTCMSNSNYGRICHIEFDAVPPVVGEPTATNVFAAFDDLNGNILGNWVHRGKTSGPDGQHDLLGVVGQSVPAAAAPDYESGRSRHRITI